jgi:hypothetical protein
MASLAEKPKPVKKPTGKKAPLSVKRKFLEYFKDLPIQKLAADHVGVHQDTVTDWKKQSPAFAKKVQELKAAWAMKHVGMVKKQEWLLERILKEEFAERKEVDLTSEKLDKALDRLSDLLP